LATWDLIPGLAESSHNLLPGLVANVLTDASPV
jgi:hypothetical protein